MKDVWGNNIKDDQFKGSRTEDEIDPKKIYVKKDNQEIIGPFDNETIKSMIHHRAIMPYWQVGSNKIDWFLVENIYSLRTKNNKLSQTEDSTGIAITSIISSSIGLLLLIGAGDVRGDDAIDGMSIMLVILGGIGSITGIVSIKNDIGKKYAIPGLILGLLLVLLGYGLLTHE